MTRCVTRGCGSYAVNHGSHGRDGSDGDLCDVCYWRKRAGGLPGWALVPVEPTPAMVDAAADAYMPFGEMELAVRMAILAGIAKEGGADAPR